MGERVLLVLAVVAAGLVWPAAATANDGVALINEQTPWRVHLISGPPIHLSEGQLQAQRGRSRVDFDPAAPDAHDLVLDRRPAFTPLARPDWTQRDFDDWHWPLYRQDDLLDYIGDHGSGGDGNNVWLTGVNLRTRFGISDPARVRGLELKVAVIGGAVVYVNGREVGRSGLPDGPLHPLTLATVYPLEVYVDDAGEVLPRPNLREQPDEPLRRRLDGRIREFTIQIPPDVLRRGSNTLAIDVRRSPAREGRFQGRVGWEHAGFRSATLRSPNADGVIAFDDATRRTFVWTAQAGQQIAQDVSEASMIRRGWHWTMHWSRGMPVRGVAVGNPFEPARPIRIAIPRNGVGSGQAVLNNMDALRDVRARLTGDLTGPEGARIPAGAVDIRYAVQPEDLHYADMLLPEPPQECRTLPVWLLVNVPADQRPGWYRTTLELTANGQRATVPVEVLVTGYRLPDPQDFSATISLEQSPRSVAMHYGVEVWSEEHWRLMEPSVRLLGQVGSSVVTVPVILSNFPAAGRPGQPGRSGEAEWHEPLIRWVRTEGGLQPDFTLLERYLDLYEKHAGRPRAISLWVWDPASAAELAHGYEGNQQPSVEVTANPASVRVWDPRSGEVGTHRAPGFLDEGAEAFWKPMFDGVRDLVRRRGWSDEVIMVGLGSDSRPGERTGERIRQWAPYARWELLSHFSADPGSGMYRGRRDEDDPGMQALAEGRLIAVGGLEIGVKRWPWVYFTRAFTAQQLEELLERRVAYLELPTARWQHQPWSPPHLFRTLPPMWGRLGRVGLDFWMPRRQGPTNTSFFSHVNAIAAAGPDGAVPTVRYQMLREGVQDHELRMAIVRAYMQLPEEQRLPYRDLLDEFAATLGQSQTYLSQHELSGDFLSYMARVQQAAAELAGEDSSASWDQPPTGR